MIRNIEVMSDKRNIQKTQASLTRYPKYDKEKKEKKNTNQNMCRKKILCKGEVDFQFCSEVLVVKHAGYNAYLIKYKHISFMNLHLCSFRLNNFPLYIRRKVCAPCQAVPLHNVDNSGALADVCWNYVDFQFNVSRQQCAIQQNKFHGGEQCVE